MNVNLSSFIATGSKSTDSAPSNANMPTEEAESKGFFSRLAEAFSSSEKNSAEPASVDSKPTGSESTDVKVAESAAIDTKDGDGSSTQAEAITSDSVQNDEDDAGLSNNGAVVSSKEQQAAGQLASESGSEERHASSEAIQSTVTQPRAQQPVDGESMDLSSPSKNAMSEGSQLLHRLEQANSTLHPSNGKDLPQIAPSSDKVMAVESVTPKSGNIIEGDVKANGESFSSATSTLASEGHQSEALLTQDVLTQDSLTQEVGRGLPSGVDGQNRLPLEGESLIPSESESAQTPITHYGASFSGQVPPLMSPKPDSTLIDNAMLEGQSNSQGPASSQNAGVTQNSLAQIAALLAEDGQPLAAFSDTDNSTMALTGEQLQVLQAMQANQENGRPMSDDELAAVVRQVVEETAMVPSQAIVEQGTSRQPGEGEQPLDSSNLSSVTSNRFSDLQAQPTMLSTEQVSEAMVPEAMVSEKVDSETMVSEKMLSETMDSEGRVEGEGNLKQAVTQTFSDDAMTPTTSSSTQSEASELATSVLADAAPTIATASAAVSASSIVADAVEMVDVAAKDWSETTIPSSESIAWGQASETLAASERLQKDNERNLGSEQPTSGIENAVDAEAILTGGLAAAGLPPQNLASGDTEDVISEGFSSQDLETDHLAANFSASIGLTEEQLKQAEMELNPLQSGAPQQQLVPLEALTALEQKLTTNQPLNDSDVQIIEGLRSGDLIADIPVTEVMEVLPALNVAAMTPAQQAMPIDNSAQARNTQQIQWGQTNQQSASAASSAQAAVNGGNVGVDGREASAQQSGSQTNSSQLAGSQSSNLQSNSPQDARAQMTQQSLAQPLSAAMNMMASANAAVQQQASGAQVTAELNANAASANAIMASAEAATDKSAEAGLQAALAANGLSATRRKGTQPDGNGSIAQAAGMQAQQPLTQQSLAQQAMRADAANQPQTAMQLTKELAQEQVQEKIQMMMSKNLKSLDIRLDPPELGRMQIRMTMNNDIANVHFTVNNPQAREMIEQTLPRLREMLAQQGMQMAESSVQQQNSGQQQGGYAASGQEGSGQSGSGSGGSGQVDENIDADVKLDLNVASKRDGISFYA